MPLTGITTMSYVGGVGGHVIPPYYSDFLRENLYSNLYFRPLGTRVEIPRGYGDKIKIPRWKTPLHASNGTMMLSAGAAASAIQENVSDGALVSAFGLSAEDITGQVVMFAGGRAYTDKLILVTRANYLEGALESLSREMAFKFDRYTRKNISANAFLAFAGSNVGKAATTDALFGKNIAKIRPYMDAHNVPAWDDEQFVALCSPLVQYDVYRDISATGFVPVARYNDAMKIYRGEIGSMYGIRFLLSNTIPIYGGTANGRQAAASATNGISAGATGSNAWVFGPDAFYTIELEDGGLEVIHHPPGSGGSTGDIANQRGSIAVKAWYGVAPAPSKDQRLMRFAHGLGLHY